MLLSKLSAVQRRERTTGVSGFLARAPETLPASLRPGSESTRKVRSAPGGEVLEEKVPDHPHARDVAERSVGDEVEDVGGDLPGGVAQPGTEPHRGQAEVRE